MINLSQSDYEKYQEEKKLNEINSKLDKIVRNTEDPSLGIKAYHAYDKWTDSKTKEIRAGIEEHRRKTGRSREDGAAQDISGGILVLLGFLIFVYSITAQHPSQHYGAILLSIILVIAGGIIVRL